MPEAPAFNPDERHVLRLAEHFRSMTATEWWKEFEKILLTQIAERERILLTPISANHEAFKGQDFTTRVVQLETIKGAIIGLKLALSIPSDTINHASSIRAEHSPDGVDDAS